LLAQADGDAYACAGVAVAALGVGAVAGGPQVDVFFGIQGDVLGLQLGALGVDVALTGAEVDVAGLNAAAALGVAVVCAFALRMAAVDGGG